MLGESLDPGVVLLEVVKRGQLPIAPMAISRREAPVAQVEWKEAEADLTRLPVYRKEEGDPRPGWLCGVAVARDPDTGRYNCSWHRHLVHGSKASAVRINYRHLWDYMQRCKQKGNEEMPVAFVFGHHPVFSLGAGSKVGLDVDEYSYAGGLLGEPPFDPSAIWFSTLLVSTPPLSNSRSSAIS